MNNFLRRCSQCIRKIALSCAFSCTFLAPGVRGLAASHTQVPIADESEWRHAREVLLRYLNERRVSVIDLYPTNHYSLGTSFWVNYGKEKKGLAIVRGQKIYIEKTSETISNLLRSERIFERQKLAAEDLLALLHFFEGIPEESQTKPCEPVYFNPKIEYHDNSATFRFAVVMQGNTCKGLTGSGGSPRLRLMTVHIQSTYKLEWETPEYL